MNYNRGAYNKGAYNRGATVANIRPLPIRGKAIFPPINSKLSLHIKGAVAGICRLHGTLRTTIRIQGTLTGKSFYKSSRLVVNIRPAISPIQALSEFSVARLKLYAVESISLPGLILQPGETLEINTDKITVEVNGINAIKYWKPGSTPIMLFENGILTYYDSNANRNAQMTLIYSDRWL